MGLDKYGTFGEHGVIEVNSKFVFVVDGRVLYSKRDKQNVLSGIEFIHIRKLDQLSGSDAREMYGRKARHGAIIISTM